ncbi:hypothetical protein [Rhodococcus sp. AD45]|uniref:TetR/AcrR family transcriptional regulator n=1 Tax=unclassified Rhodococcus (in: high G+C Gram-positive bacteria) TaxID=192944 RepID=UPI001392331B|nr:hypothetical protein [Rhodococcus sp. AD45]
MRSRRDYRATSRYLLVETGRVQSVVATTIGGNDAELRAALLNACTLGVTITRYLLKVPAMAQADHSDIERLLVPALRALVEAQPTAPDPQPT